MSVNFTGIKNVGSMLVRTPNPNQNMKIVSLQVTNDEQGNDLDKFNDAINKTGNPKDFKTAYEGAVSINVFTNEPEEEYERPEHSFYLNGSPLEANDKNLPVFTYIANLTKTISNKKDDELKATKEYVTSPDFLNGSAIGYFIKKIFAANPNVEIFPILNSFYIPENARTGAKLVNYAVQDTMTDYFA